MAGSRSALKHVLLVSTILAVAGWGHSARSVPGSDLDKGFPAMLAGYVVVKFKTTQPLEGTAKTGWPAFDTAAGRLQIRQIRPLFARRFNEAGQKWPGVAADLRRVHEVRYDAGVSPRIAAAMLSRDPNVEYAEPRYVYSLSSAPEFEENGILTPNDPIYGDMDHLRHIRMPEAWETVKASDAGVLVAVVDAGTEWRHPDFEANVWRNPAEVDGNGEDDDRNGYVDDVHGWNFANGTNDPTGLSETPANGRHGTIVAGIVGAVTDNGIGIAGASWNAGVMPVNVACPDTDNAVCFGYDGVMYAALNGADVISISWGGPDSFLGRDVVRAATEMGSLLIVSAGNNGGGAGTGGNIDLAPAFPASYDRVLVVGATGKNNDAKAAFSNFGLSVDVFAPGTSINSIFPGGGYTSDASGTSFSTPLVASLAAMLRALHPEWSPDRIREQIRVTSDPIDADNQGSLAGLLGRGRINAARAIGEVTRSSVRILEMELIDSGNDGTVQSGETVQVELTLINYLADASNIVLSLVAGDPLVDVRDGELAIGELRSNELTTASFSFSLSSATPSDYPLVFRLEIKGDAYEDAELIRLVANRVTHNTGSIEMSLTDQGNIGWSDFQGSSQGRGFRFLGVDWLFEGGLLIGTREDRISDSVRNTGQLTQDEDLSRPEGSFFGITPGIETTEAGLVILTDEEAADPIGIRVHQESYADTRTENNQFILVRYFLSHADKTTDQVIDNLFVGLFCDWDLTIGGDYARFDSGRRMGVVQSSAEDPVVLFGTRMLTNDASLSYRSIDNVEIFDSRSGGDGFTNAEKWSYLTGGIQMRDVDDADVSTLVAAGPYRIEPGSSVEIAYALIAGLGTEEFETAADRAGQFWSETIRGLDPNPVSVEAETPISSFLIDAPFPNPVRFSATFPLRAPGSGTIDISIYDILGREVYNLVGEPHGPGLQRIQWDTRDGSGSLVPGGLYVYRIRATLPDGIHTATQKFVVVR